MGEYVGSYNMYVCVVDLSVFVTVGGDPVNNTVINTRYLLYSRLKSTNVSK